MPEGPLWVMKRTWVRGTRGCLLRPRKPTLCSAVKPPALHSMRNSHKCMNFQARVPSTWHHRCLFLPSKVTCRCVYPNVRLVPKADLASSEPSHPFGDSSPRENALANTQHERLRHGNHAPELEFSYLLTTMADHAIMSAKRSSTSADMSGNPMPAPEGAPVLSSAPVAPPTGYRVSILPAALEISARIATADELQNLVKILQANAAIWASVTKNEAA